MENVSLLDIVSIALILFLGIKGFFRGFVKEVFGLIGIIGGIYVASRFAQSVGEYLDVNFLHLTNKGSIYLIGFIAALIIFWLLASFVGMLLGKLVASSGLNVVDRILGFFAGAAKIFLIFSIIIHVISSIPVFKTSVKNIFEGSMMYPIFLEYGSKIVQTDALDQWENQIKIDSDSDNEEESLENKY
jgi:membrane protein required for colicin V production